MAVPKLFEKSIGVVLTLLTSFFVAVFSFCRTTSLSNSPRYVTAEFARQIPKNISQITSQERLKPLLPKTFGKTLFCFYADGFECCDVVFAASQHHRGSAAVAERGAEIHDRGNRPKSLNPSTPNRRQAQACFFVCMSSVSSLT